MLTTRSLVLGCLMFAMATPLMAQQFLPWPTLSTLVRAKLDPNDGKPQLILMLQSYRMEKMAKPVAVKKTRIETRVRTVKINDREVEQVYQVAVPYTEQVTEIAKSAGLKPTTFDISKFKIYDLDANVVSIEEASKRLEKLTPVFLLENTKAPKFNPVPELQKSILKPGSLVIVSADKIHKRP